MKTILLLLFVMFATSIMGYEIMFVLQKIIGCKNKENIMIFYPVIGTGGIIVLMQLLNLLFTGMVATWIIIVGMIILGVFSAPSLETLKRYINEAKWIFPILLLSILIVGYPIVMHIGYSSIQFANNDIAYYLSSTEWIKSHSLHEKYIWNADSQFFSLAWYMVTYTRFGVDEFMAFLASVFNFEAYQVFSIICIWGTLLSSLAISYFIKSFCGGTKRESYICMILMAMGIPWIQLIAFQYAPQIYGMVFLFIFWVLLAMERKSYWQLISLFLCFTFTTYSEFAAYILVFLITFLIIDLLLKKNKKENLKEILLRYIKIGLLSIVLNPIGFIITLKFNINIFMRVIKGTDSIDPYHGNLMSGSKLFFTLAGLSGLERVDEKILQLITILAIISILIIIFVGVRKNWQFIGKEKMYYITGTFLFFAGYEILFRIKAMGYQEYKHIMSCTIFLSAIIFFCLITSAKGKVFYQVCSIIYVLLMLIATKNNYDASYSNLYYYDDELEQVGESCLQIVGNNYIEVEGNIGDVHGLMYALRKCKAYPAADTNSYYDAFEKEQLYDAPYYIKLCNSVNENEQIIEYLGKYALCKKKPVMLQYIDGVYDLESDGNGNFRWTSLKKIHVQLTNSTDKECKIKLKLKTDNLDNEKIPIIIECNNIVVGKGVIGDEISTDNIIVPANAVTDIYIESEKEPIQLAENDPRLLGYKIRLLRIE